MKFAIMMLFIALSTGAYGQRLEPLQGNTQPLAEAPGPNLPPKAAAGVGIAGIGIKPAQGIGLGTKGTGTQTSGYGRQITGYGPAVQGTTPNRAACNSYPPNPYSNCR